MVRAPVSPVPALLTFLLISLFLLAGCSSPAPPPDNPDALPEGVTAVPIPVPPPAPVLVNNTTKAQSGVSSDEAKNDMLTLLGRANSTDLKIRYQLVYKMESAPPPSTLTVYKKSDFGRTDISLAGLNTRTYSNGSAIIVCIEGALGWTCSKAPSSAKANAIESLQRAELAMNQGNFTIRPDQTYAGILCSCYRVWGGRAVSINGQTLSPNVTDMCLSSMGILFYSRLQGEVEGSNFEYTMTALDYSSVLEDSDFELPAPLAVPTPPHMEMVFYNVGMGDATLVAADNFTMLIDTGPLNTSEALATSLMQRDISNIDVLLISSWDLNKLGGLDSIFKRFTVSEIWLPGAAPSSRSFDYAQTAMRQAAARVRNISSGDRFRYGLIALEVFNPPKKLFSQSPEANSVVLRLWYHGFCAFMPGDIENAQHASLVGLVGSLPCDIYKWPYHGRGRPEASLLFDKLRPTDVVISVGPGDPNLPSSTTLERLRISKTNLWRTDTVGDIFVNVSQSGAFAIGPGNGAS